MPKRVLVVEDNADIAHLVTLHLRDQNMEVDHVSDGHHALQRTASEHYDLVILDLMLPGLDGMEVCRALRRKQAYTPILMLTARSSELDRVLGLEIGADDYLTKPFSVRELIARAKAILRRVDAFSPDARDDRPAAVCAGALHLDPDKREVRLHDNIVDLTAREFDLLWHFARNPGRVYTRTQLLDAVWGHAYEGYEHTVNSHINRLRAKIETDPARPGFVLTVWGVGYKFADLRPVAGS
jgi:DNA-binding response OmpR family regulator